MDHSDKMENAIRRCIRDVLADKPVKGWRQKRLWHKRWKQMEYELYLSDTFKWYALKEALNRIGGF